MERHGSTGGRLLSGLAVGVASGVGNAWMAELIPGNDRARAALISAVANFIGLVAGSLLGGCLAQYAPWPLQLPFAIYFVALVVLAGFIRATPETVQRRAREAVSLRPHLGVPRTLRKRFIAPAICGFGTFSLVGFYAALTPSLLKERLQIDSVAVSGAVLGEMFLVSALATIATRKLASTRAMLIGLSLLLPSLGLLVLADVRGSLPLLLVDSALTGLSAALGYRGSLQTINDIAPAAQRGEVMSSYFVACFVGNSVPVIGIGVAAAAWGSVVAVTVFASLLALFAVGALAAGLKYRPAARLGA
jgi:MFS family permease